MRRSCSDKIEQMREELIELASVQQSFCTEMKEAGDCNENGCPFADNCPEEFFSDAMDFKDASSEIRALVKQWKCNQDSKCEGE